MTFDGGSGAQGARSILATLKSDGVPATFFLTGQFAKANPDVVAAIVSGHYVVGNHTMTHPHLTQLSSAAVTTQVSDAGRQLTATAGVNPRPWFRFPFGEYDDRTLAVVNALGYAGIGWTIDSRGWLGTSDGTVDDVVRHVLSLVEPGAIVLMHLGANPDDGTTFDADALPRVIAGIKAKGYAFVTVAALLR